jgi:hypothetical protein
MRFSLFITVGILSLIARVSGAEDIVDGFKVIATNPDIEEYHAEQQFLLASSCFTSALHGLAGDTQPPERHRLAVERWIEAERGTLDARKRTLGEIRLALADGGRLFWGSRRDEAVFAKGYLLVRDGVIVRRWLYDWGVRQSDGSWRTDSVPPPALSDKQ